MPFRWGRSPSDLDKSTTQGSNATSSTAATVQKRTVLTEKDAPEVVGEQFSPRRKWTILTAVFLVQISMNFNTTVYGSATPGLQERFGLSQAEANYGRMIYLLAYAFGCELWAPWSEELGRKWILQASLGLVNLWQIPCALAPNFATIVVCRGLAGLCSAGGSVTLGVVADLYGPAWQQYANAYVCFASVAGSVIGPIFGGFIETYLSWPWVFWIQLLFGIPVQLFHLCVSETRTEVLLDQEARRRRKTGQNPHIYGPLESKGTLYQRLSWKKFVEIMWRPYKFLLTEPIVTFLSLLSGFSDALIFTGLDSFPLVMQQWNFNAVQIGLSFIPLLISYFIAYFSFFPVYHRDRKVMNGDTNALSPERRLWWLLFLVLLEPLGLLAFGFSSLGPPAVHWIAPLISSGLIGIANYAIYVATIDYMIAAYGPMSASATGGNGFCRDLLAGLASLYATPLYEHFVPGTKWQLVIPSLMLAGIGVVLCIPVYVFYIKGEWFRNRSPYALHLATEREGQQGTELESHGGVQSV